jgi:hypothetical protein
VTLPTIDPEPTMVVECASCRPSCWLLGRARPSSVEGGRGAGKGLNTRSSGAGGSGGGGTMVKGGGTGECAEVITATIPCKSPRAIDRSRDMFTTKTEDTAPQQLVLSGCRESRPPSVRWGSTWGGACARRGDLPETPFLRHAPFSKLNSSLKHSRWIP